MRLFIVYINMVRKDYEKLFAHLKTPEPPDGLLTRILQRIQREKRREALQWRCAFWGTALAGSAAALIPATSAARSALTESGFTEFFSLAFSNPGIAMNYFDSFAAALLESLPIMSIALFLAVVAALLHSLRCAARDFKIVFAR